MAEGISRDILVGWKDYKWVHEQSSDSWKAIVWGHGTAWAHDSKRLDRI